MSVTFDQLRQALMADEPDYNKLSALGPAALPHLAALIDGPVLHLAAKAASLAGRIGTPAAAPVLARAAASPQAVVRVAAADAARSLDPALAAPILAKLLDDADPGIRRLSLRAVPAIIPEQLRPILARRRVEEPVVALRELVQTIEARAPAPPLRPRPVR